MVKNYYEILGVQHGATLPEITKAYHKMALICHPDKSSDPQAAERFHDVREAYTVLFDNRKRFLRDTFFSTAAFGFSQKRRPMNTKPQPEKVVKKTEMSGNSNDKKPFTDTKTAEDKNEKPAPIRVPVIIDVGYEIKKQPVYARTSFVAESCEDVEKVKKLSQKDLSFPHLLFTAKQLQCTDEQTLADLEEMSRSPTAAEPAGAGYNSSDPSEEAADHKNDDKTD